ASDDRLDPGQLLGLLGADLANAGMGMGRTQDAPDQHAGSGGIGAEAGPPGDLVDTVRAQRPGSDHVEFTLEIGFDIEWHGSVTCSAALLGARETEAVAQAVEQGLLRLADEVEAVAIDGGRDMNSGHYRSPAR